MGRCQVLFPDFLKGRGLEFGAGAWRNSIPTVSKSLNLLN